MKPKLIIGLAGLALMLGGTGCKTLSRLDSSYWGPFHQTHNHYVAPTGIGHVRRVAVMPLVAGRGNSLTIRGTELLQPVLNEELARAGVFESVPLTKRKLEYLTGAPEVRPDEPLPNNFAEILQRMNKRDDAEEVCQAVLFCELTTYRPDPPMALGWKLHLFDLKSGELLWAFDETFDAGNPKVSNSLRRFLRTHRLVTDPAAHEWMVLNSPRHLSRFSLAMALDTLRKNIPKEPLETADNEDSQ
ncbi:MAG: hypothetical protein VX705_05170 [Verrucomicrobiota bacterium]|nr:hypothetical protein [Verrucomicrobiota bacterium]